MATILNEPEGPWHTGGYIASGHSNSDLLIYCHYCEQEQIGNKLRKLLRTGTNKKNKSLAICGFQAKDKIQEPEVRELNR